MTSGHPATTVVVAVIVGVLLLASATAPGRAAGPPTLPCRRTEEVALARAEAAPPALSIEADTLTYDDLTRVVEAQGRVALTYRGVAARADAVRILLDTQTLEARGHVVVVDSLGRELRGEALVYDAQAEVAEMAPAETIVGGVYIRAARLRARPDRLEAVDTTLTTCNPARPAYRVTAGRIEVIPADRVTAYGATLWWGRHWILGLPVLQISLRSPRETAGSFPTVGYDNVNGLWAAYRYAFAVGTPLAYVSTTQGTLAQRVEAGLVVDPQPLGTLPLHFSGGVSAGWHREQVTGVETTRLGYQVGLRTPTLSLGPRTDGDLSWTWEEASYGSGDRWGVSRTGVAVTHHLAADVSLALTYDQLRPVGTPPLARDAVNPADVLDRLAVTYQKVGARDDGGTTRVTAAASYDLLTQTPSVGVAYGERLPRAYHWEVGPTYNLTTRVTTLRVDTGLALGADTYVTVQATYNTATTLFEELDYILTAQIQDCFELSIKFRQARQELWISLGLAAFPQAQVQFQFRGP